MFHAYPSHRFHPSFKSYADFELVKDEDEDSRLMDSDPLWRDIPYSDEERAEWHAKHPGARRAKMPLPGEQLVDAEPPAKKKRPKPLRRDFKDKAEFAAAVKVWEKEE